MIPGTFRKPSWHGYDAWELTLDELEAERLISHAPARDLPANAGYLGRDRLLGGAPGELGAGSRSPSETSIDRLEEAA